MRLRLLLVLLAVFSCQAAEIRGVIKDQTGAVIANANVSATGPGDRLLQTLSGPDGAYRFTGLVPGMYTLHARAPQLKLKGPIPVQLGSQPAVLNLTLQVVGKTEEVTVGSSSDKPTVGIDAANSAGSVSIKGDALKSLADNPEDLQADLQALAGPAAGPSGGSVYIDGFSTGQVPPKESIREVRVNQDPFAPEFDKLGFGRVEIFTKPGASKWTGSAGFNFANDFWNARNPYAAQKAPLLLVESENILQGPISKKATLSLDFERHGVDNGSVVNAVILNPDTLASELYTAIPKSFQRRLLFTPRLDLKFSDRQTLSFRYNITWSNVRQFGIGQFDLPSRGYKLENRFDTVQISHNYVAGSWINDLRYQLYRWRHRTNPDRTGPTIQVLGAFTSGAAQVGESTDTQTNHELQDYVSLNHGAHTWRFGVRLRGTTDNSLSLASFNGTYVFSSLQAYRTTLDGLNGGLSPAVIRSLGGGASQFTLTGGTLALRANQFDLGTFVGDSWRLRPNLLLDLGMRYEYQTNLKDNANFGPRVGLAWSPFPAAHHATVLRAGFGVFYDRFALANVIAARRYNGVNQQQFVLLNPNTFPGVPSASALASQGTPQILQRLSGNLSAPYLMQTVVAVEQQVSKDATLSVSYTGTRGVHILRSLDVNAPVPGTQVFPAGSPSPTYLMTSSGIFNQNQLIANLSYKPVTNVSLFGYYVFGHARSNSDGLTTFPANPYSFTGEYGPAAIDIRHRVLAGGSLALRWGIRLSPYIQVQSGPPFNITTGLDPYRTALFNARPGLSFSPEAGFISTPYGYLNPNPGLNDLLLSRNAGRGPGSFTTNLRISKAFAFGASKDKTASNNTSLPKIDAAQMSSPGALRGLFTAPPLEGRYNLTIGLSIRNLTNYSNPGPIIGTLTSPLFGQANQLAGGPNAEGFSESASNRRLELQLRFEF